MNILITGGSSGLGMAITRKIAGNGHKVYFTYNSSVANAQQMEQDLEDVIAVKCNFKDAEDVDTLKNKIKEWDIDVLINNAYTGDPIKTYFHKIPAGDFLTDFKENLVPTITLTQAAIEVFRKKKSGKIITILTSFLVNTPPMGSSVYIANKAYLEQLTKVWATENAKYNITSNSVSPSFMLTPFTDYVDERLIEQMIENHPLKKLLTVEEVAESVYFLLTATPHINGVNIVLNAATNIK